MRLGRMNLGVWSALALLLIGVRTHGALLGDQEYDRYSVLLINDQRVGFMREYAAVDGETLISSSQMVMRIARFDDELRITITTEFVETIAGEPLSMRSTADMGGSETIEAYVWDGERVKHTTINGDRRTVREAKAPGENWLTPGQVGVFVEKRIRAGAEKVIYSTIDPSTGLDRVLSTLERTGTEEIEVLGEKVEAVRWTVKQSAMPGLEMTNYTDERGETLRTEMPFGGLRMVIVRSEREEALKDLPAVEMMASTLVKPKGEIRSPRTSTRGVYRLSSTVAGQQLPEPPTTGSQRVEKLENGSMRVTVDLNDPVVADEKDAADERYRIATTAADANDQAVRELSERALEGVADDASDRAKAEAMRKFVYRFITDKQLGVGFASASEVARNPAGDCTEHAVLLAAMLRAQGIPSRGANGLIFINQFGEGEKVFGYHMWTQALVEDERGRLVWLDLDSAWPRAMDATHITTSVSDLGDGSMLDSYATIARLLGVLAIEVEEVE